MAGSACALALAVFSAMPAQAAQPLTWSIAGAYVHDCVKDCVGANVLSKQANFNFGPDLNASGSLSINGMGSGVASAAPGAGMISAPALKVAGSGAAWNGSSYGAGGAYALAFERVRWMGAAVDLGVDSFIGTFDYDTSGSGTGVAYAALTLIDGNATFDLSRRTTGSGTDLDWWYSNDPFLYGKSVSCSGPRAIAHAQYGVKVGTSQGANSTVLTPDCGTPTFHLNTGDTFWMFARVGVAQYGPGTTDASHTFTVDLNPNLGAARQQYIASNLMHLSSTAMVPEPAAWAMMIAGFGLSGAALRRSRRLSRLAVA